MLRDIEHQYVLMPEERVEKGLAERATPDQADLLVLVPRRRGWRSRLLHTRHMTFSTQIPLLVLPDPN